MFTARSRVHTMDMQPGRAYITYSCTYEDTCLVSSRVTMDSQDNFTVFSRVNNMDSHEEFTVFSRVYSRISRRHHGNQERLVVCSRVHIIDNH